ncbi:MAG: hypothetical protein A3J24_10955 [Deltaproteobacteria bacterium RIFCSPLOWO2_02_FULL_53_8]|nr:MAG: hypothetical protein A3J24_10955 [Deltaproteobacteria bacterium RIFCSPLOWO2_02_FULL_53_8]
MGKLVKPVVTWNPLKADHDDEFDYIDLSAVDQDTKTITAPKKIACSEAPSRARQIVSANDVLVSTVRPNLNGVARVPFELDQATASTGFCVLRTRSDSLNSSYLFHWVKSPQFVAEMTKKATGQSYPAVSDKIISESLIPVPPLPEQIRIAAILDQADALRVKRREALAQLDSLTQAIFIDMFGDPVANQKGWEKKTFSKLLEKAEVFVDGDWVESKDQDPEGGVRLVQLADIGDGYYVNKSARFLNKPTATRLKCTVLKQGDVLIARMPDPLGRACLFPGDEKECVTVVDVCIVRTKNNEPDHTWLMCCINSHAFRSEIAGEATGATRVRISRGNLSRLEIIAPPIALQREFADRISVVDKLKTAHSASLTELDNLFDSLQHRAFRGEL